MARRGSRLAFADSHAAAAWAGALVDGHARLIEDGYRLARSGVWRKGDGSLTARFVYRLAEPQRTWTVTIRGLRL